LADGWYIGILNNIVRTDECVDYFK